MPWPLVAAPELASLLDGSSACEQIHKLRQWGFLLSILEPRPRRDDQAFYAVIIET